MGLDVQIYQGVKPHECETKSRLQQDQHYGRRINTFSSDMYEFLNKKSSEAAEVIQKYGFTHYREVYVCDCIKEGKDNILFLCLGYKSCLDVKQYPYFGPYEYDDVDGFYFGSYAKVYRAFKAVSFFRFFSDCDGSYAGKEFLETMKNELYTEKEKDPDMFGEYYSLLDGNDLANCVVRHT